MNKMVSIALKDIKIRFSRPVEWLLFLVLPVVFTVTLSGSLGGSSDPRLPIAVVDQANSPLSQELVGLIQKSEVLRPELESLAQAQSQLSMSEVTAELVIPAEFDVEHLETGDGQLVIYQPSGRQTDAAVQQAVYSVVQTISSTINAARYSTAVAEKTQPFASASERLAYFEGSIQAAKSLLDKAAVNNNLSSNISEKAPDIDPRARASAGQLIGWTFIVQLTSAVIFVTERRKGTLHRLWVTPTGKYTILVGTIIGQAFIAVSQMILLAAFGILVLKLNWGRDPLALTLMILATSMAASALGTAMGTFVRTERQAASLSVILGLMMSILGGISYPLELFPKTLQVLSMIFPTRWSMQGMLDIVQRGLGLNAVLPDAAVLCGFALACIAIGVHRFTYE